MKKARGMPDVSLRPDTEQYIAEQEAKLKADSEKVEDQKIFERPLPDGSIAQPDKPINAKLKTIIEETAEDTESVERQGVEMEIKKKVKKKLTEKQLNALKMGREKSIAIRRQKAEEKKKAKAIKPPKHHIQADISPTEHRPQIPVQTPTHNFGIDYDKIINGVADIYDKRRKHEEKVNYDVKAFELKVREEERNRVLSELEKIQKEEEHTANTKVAESVLQRNPYAYAFDMNSRKRYMRY